jgi:hypothetical protein
MGMNEEFEDNRNIYLLEGACSAPTFSQCFRWFREKYNIWCWNEKYTEDETYIYQIPKFNFKKIQGYYKSYEEAELACLK